MVIVCCKGRCTCCDKHDLRFAEHSTCHGVARFCNTWHIGRRLFWFCFVFASMALLTQQLSERISNFLNFELKTEISIVTYPSLELPSVTICNMNMFSYSLLEPMDYELLDLSESLIDWIKDNQDWDNATCMNNYWEKVKEFEAMELAILNKYNVTEDFSVRRWLRRTGWQLNKTEPAPTLIACNVGRTSCSVDDFKQVLTPQGLCYTINHDRKFSQKLPGIEAGFNILIDIDQTDYTAYKLDSKSQYECGAKVLLHESFDQVYSGTNLAYFVGVDPGRMGFISGQKYNQIRENNWPWDTCLNQASCSKRNCLARCTAQDTVVKCGCRLWFEASDIDGYNCGVAQTTACLIYKETVNNATVDENCHHDCIHSCNETTYEVAVSYTILTSNLTSTEFINQLHDLTNHSFQYDAAYVERNILSLQIAYPDLVVEKARSTPAFPTSAFVSDLGGQLGLFAGISIVTIAELLEYPFVKLYNTFFTKNRKLRKHQRQKNGCKNVKGLKDVECGKPPHYTSKDWKRGKAEETEQKQNSSKGIAAIMLSPLYNISSSYLSTSLFYSRPAATSKQDNQSKKMATAKLTFVDENSGRVNNSNMHRYQWNYSSPTTTPKP